MIEIVLNRDHYINRDHIIRWCVDNFGPMQSAKWSMSGAFGHQCYRFTREEDATLFTLKWK